ncbi:hypothetical protein M0813_02414 [Anaeramoeba flamelloides]|uniref:Uncharacterized protein n=1 Tax=Anaeramoeba flamelloides TaxID=1746091 RepID=A0ABQ8YIM1_9EUKA|nr:hypothetical protein M0813_02414 [Anaeramoeba flamelloides]
MGGVVATNTNQKNMISQTFSSNDHFQNEGKFLIMTLETKHECNRCCQTKFKSKDKKNQEKKNKIPIQPILLKKETEKEFETQKKKNLTSSNKNNQNKALEEESDEQIELEESGSESEFYTDIEPTNEYQESSNDYYYEEGEDNFDEYQVFEDSTNSSGSG